MCGGTLLGDYYCPYHNGLSPRVRGNRQVAFRAASGQRSIPACAGEPPSRAAPLAGDRVYPRVCGGTECRVVYLWRVAGLSPRVRGNLRLSHPSGGSGGSIPACAGEPGCRRPCGPVRGVYPRVCGGTLYQVAGGDGDAGLSPRVRGNPVRQAGRESPCRSIPACAGEPGWGSPATPAYRVYPRVCGGTSLVIAPLLAVVGLSPRVRGNLTLGAVKRKYGGSIPACAGEPRLLPHHALV